MKTVTWPWSCWMSFQSGVSAIVLVQLGRSEPSRSGWGCSRWDEAKDRQQSAGGRWIAFPYSWILEAAAPNAGSFCLETETNRSFNIYLIFCAPCSQWQTEGKFKDQNRNLPPEIVLGNALFPHVHSIKKHHLFLIFMLFCENTSVSY